MASGIIFLLSISIVEKKTVYFQIFPITLIYNTDKIYSGNHHFMLYPLLQKSSDVNRYLQFLNIIAPK